MKVVVFGLGYVGTVSAACLADLGHDVVGVDSKLSKVEMVAAGLSPVTEPGLEQLLGAGFRSGRISATQDIAVALQDADVSLVCVGTPSRGNGSLDLEFVRTVTEEIGAHLQLAAPGHVVAYRSTMLPGTVADVLTPILEAVSGRRPGTDFGVAFCPEFLREATALSDFRRPPYTVFGVSDDGAELALRLLFDGIDAPVHVVATGTAEALKYASNAFHAVKVTFANEMGRFCSSVGVDAREVMGLFVQDGELNVSSRYLRPGFAFGGSCLPKDIRALVHRARSQDVDLPLLESLMPSNARHVDEAVSMVTDIGSRSVALLGLSFKPGTDDLRESPFVTLAEILIGKGYELRIFDPILNPETLVGANLEHVRLRLPHLVRLLKGSVQEALSGAGCAILANPEPSVVEPLLSYPDVPIVDLTGGLDSVMEQQLAQRDSGSKPPAAELRRTFRR